jgi:HPt (histidine-containing phosphotransfer) domain-containing protein
MSDSGADSSAQSPAWDRDALRRELAGDDGVVHELVELYCRESPQLRQAVHAALEQVSADKLRRAAHSLKGTLASLRAHQASTAAEALERLGRAGNLAAAPAVLHDLAQKLEQLHIELQRYLSERRRP